MSSPRSCLPALIAAVAIGSLVAGCGITKSQPTPIIVYYTPVPTATPVPTPTPSPTPSPSPTDRPSPTPRPTLAAVPSTSCSGSVDNQSFFGQAARAMSWDVYCPSLATSWYVTAGKYEESGGGWLKITWAGPGGATLQIAEGAFCTSGADACGPKTGQLGNAYFGDLAGSLDSVSGGLAIYVNPGTARAYSIVGTGLSQSDFVAVGAAMLKVAR